MRPCRPCLPRLRSCCVRSRSDYPQKCHSGELGVIKTQAKRWARSWKPERLAEIWIAARVMNATAAGNHFVSQPTRDEAMALLRGGLADEMRRIAASYVMPIFWITARDRRPWVLDNGSCFLLDCGQGPFLVTANHVFQGFRAAKQQHEDAICIVGDVPFDPVKRLIAFDSAYDVATFRVLKEEIAQLESNAGKIVLRGSQSTWPPEPPAIDRGVFFVGFPGDGRAMKPYRGNSVVEIDWTGYTSLAVASGVSTTDITLLFDHEQDFDVGLRPTIPEDWALGGCSGAPLLTFVDQRGVFSWRLGGIISESSDRILKAARANCLNPDGTVNPFPNPMAYK